MEENGFVLQPWVCQTCLPKKTMFSQNPHLHNGLHPFKKEKKRDFSKWFRKIHLFNLDKSRYTTKITNQDTQSRSQNNVYNRDYKTMYMTEITSQGTNQRHTTTITTMTNIFGLFVRT